MALILIVEDEKLLRWTLSERLKRGGHNVLAAADLEEAARHLRRHQPEVLLLDISLPDGNGLDFYQSHAPQLEETAVIVMTAVGQIEEAVRAMKLGAQDFLTKPVDQEELQGLVERSVSRRGEQLEAQAARQRRERELGQVPIAESPVFRRVVELVEDVATSEVSSVLIQGESGCGKNVLARYLHARSRRHRKPLLEVSCAAIPDSLMESELLGHEKGAFTDARATRKGVFELAEGGTVVLDEVGELKLELQAKLLHLLEERRLRRVGGTREIYVDVRVLALTNRDLQAMVNAGAFRHDLFFRLNVFPITVPPLRDHPEDILPLAWHFAESLQPKYGRSLTGFSREAENLLLGYSWPGNIRELRNVIERAMVLERSERLTPESLLLDAVRPVQAPAASGAVEDGASPPASDAAELSAAGVVPLAALEEEMIGRAMRATGGNQTRAAELLGITRDQLRYRLKKVER